MNINDNMNKNTYEYRRNVHAQQKSVISSLKRDLKKFQDLYYESSSDLKKLRDTIIQVSTKAEKDGVLTDELISLSFSASII